jgi:hypothetical protein
MQQVIVKRLFDDEKDEITPANVTSKEVSNIAGWTSEQVEQKYLEVRLAICYESTIGSALKWWQTF